MLKLSIITVNLNNKTGLANTAKSIVSQTSHDYEWIIIDGGSTDGSADVIKEYADKTDRLTYWCSEPDGGIYQGMNKGIRKAQGDYCLFLNSGDCLISSETLANVFKEIDGKEFDIFYSDTIKSDNNTVQYPKHLTIEFLLKEPINHQNSLITRSLFINHGFYNENLKMASDWEFLLNELWKYKSTFYHIETNISIFDINGISSRPSTERTLETTTIVRNVFHELSDIMIEYRKFSGSVYCDIIRTYGNSKFLNSLLKRYRQILRITKRK